MPELYFIENNDELIELEKTMNQICESYGKESSIHSAFLVSTLPQVTIGLMRESSL